MGVNTFLLDRRRVKVLVGSTTQDVGTLRRYFKLTEMDAHRGKALDDAASVRPSPTAALVIDVTEMPLAAAPTSPARAHLLLGWDEGRGSVTDFGWDHLPVLGYCVRDPQNDAYVLFEEQSGLLHLIDDARAAELHLLDAAGVLVRQGQPTIEVCHSVCPYISGYAEADCSFDNGKRDKLLVDIVGDQVPPPSWLVGKRPRDVKCYRAD